MTSWERYYADKPKTHYVYRAFDADGRCLYVGCTNRPKQRLGEHRRGSAWWPFAVRFEVDADPQVNAYAWRDERREIERLRPVFNLGHNHEFHKAGPYLVAAAHAADRRCLLFICEECTARGREPIPKAA